MLASVILPPVKIDKVRCGSKPAVFNAPRDGEAAESTPAEEDLPVTGRVGSERVASTGMVGEESIEDVAG